MPAHKKTPLHHQDLPPVPSLMQTIGPSFILLGLALGSGEVILWPYLTATYGLGLIWGALLGISLQFLLNTEVMRYSVAHGESVFLGFRRLSRIWPVWYILSTFLPWSIPGFSTASAEIVGHVTGLPVLEKPLAIALLVFTGIILSSGKTLYHTMEWLQRTVVIVALPIIFGLTLWFARAEHWQAWAWGLVGRGDGWWFFPPGIALASFLGAFAYSGAGGNLNLSQSYYVKEKGFGMGIHLERISSLFRGGTKSMRLEGNLFRHSHVNQKRWQAWWRFVVWEHALVFLGLGFFTISLLAVLAAALTGGHADESGLAFLYTEARMITKHLHPAVGTFFLLLAATTLFTTQLGVLESAARIISENVLLLRYRPGRQYNLSLWFYAALWGQIALGVTVILAGIREPRLLLTAAALLNGAAMMVSFPLIYWLNRRHLPLAQQPRLARTLGIFAGFAFFALFFVLLFLERVSP